MAVADMELTDDEWREKTFSTEELICALLSRRHGEPTMKELAAAMDKYGPEGILEAAILLPRKQYEELAKRAKKAQSPAKRRRR